MEALSTREKLLMVGQEEFLAKGYKDASLREIGKKAGFTPGAFYGYYKSKEALFEELVGAAGDRLFDAFLCAQEDFAGLPRERQTRELAHVSGDSMQRMLDIIYGDPDAYKLLFFRAEGTRYEGYIQRFIEVEVASTHRFIGILREQGYTPDVDDEIIHILASAMFSGMLEVVDHGMSREKAARYVTQLRAFYTAGWYKLLGL